MDNYNYSSYPQGVVYEQSVAKAMRKVYMKMFLALLVTATTSFAVLLQGSFLEFMLTNRYGYLNQRCYQQD